MTKFPTKKCNECDGNGYTESDVPRPHGFDRDIGCIDSASQICEKCQGLGIISDEEDIDF